jgi:hypothetical protein
LVSVIFQLTTFQLFEFHRDELLYFSLSEHLDFGYQSVPPLIGVLAFISIKLFGYTLFAVKVLPALAGGLLIFLSSLVAKEMKGGFYSQVLTALCILSSLLFVRASGLFQPVIFDILFWTLSIFLIIRYFNTDNQKYLISLGICIGIGFLNKYNMIFLVFSLFLAILLTDQRKIFASKYLYIAAFIAFVIVLPNIIWQIVHKFPVISHMGELRESQLVNMNPATFLTEQLLMVLPSTIIAIPGLFLLIFYKPLKDYRVLGYFAFIVLLIFLLLQGKTYYTAGIYPMLIAGGSVAFEKIFTRNYSRIILIATILFIGYIILPMGKPVYNQERLVTYFDNAQKITGTDAVRRDEDNIYHKLPQDYADMLGWEELTLITNEAWKRIPNKENAIIYCENYGQAGAITIIGKQYNLPEPVSFNDNFKYWIPESYTSEITEVIYINDEVGDDVRDLFEDVEEIGKISNPLAREYGTGVYLCRDPRRSFNAFWEEIIKNL